MQTERQGENNELNGEFMIANFKIRRVPSTGFHPRETERTIVKVIASPLVRSPLGVLLKTIVMGVCDEGKARLKGMDCM